MNANNMIGFNFDVNQFAQQMGEAVQKASESMGTTAGQLWSIGVQGMSAKGAALIVMSGIILSAAVFLFFLGRHFWKESRSPESERISYSDRENMQIIGGVLCLASVISLIPMAVVAYEGIMRLVAPRYMLLQEIADAAQAIFQKQ